MIAIPMIIMSDILNMFPQRHVSLTSDLYKWFVTNWESVFDREVKTNNCNENQKNNIWCKRINSQHNYSFNLQSRFEKIEVKKLKIWVCDIKQTKEKIGNVGSLNKMHEIHAWQYK